MNALRRLISLAGRAGPVTRRLLPPTIGGLGVYMLLQTHVSSDFLKRARTHAAEITYHKFLSGVMTAKAEAKYRCQDLVGSPSS